jgi:endonuclease YncB( thermonuclease family)
MRRRRRKPSWRWLLVLLIGLGVQVWKDWQDGPAPAPRKTASKVFEVILDASWHPHRDNDGDSFHLLIRGRPHELRLYFADCPEKQRHHLNGDRLAEQGRSFGGLSEAQTVAVGKQAQAFTQQWLTTQRFTVYTKWQSVYNSGRHYAFVVFADGEDLSAKLVRAGLARIHTGGTTLPDGRTTKQYEAFLRQLEAEARAAQRGGWAF